MVATPTWQATVLEWLEVNERSQSWLARKASMDVSWINQILSGRKTAGWKAIQRIEVALGLARGSLGDLVG